MSRFLHLVLALCLFVAACSKPTKTPLESLAAPPGDAVEGVTVEGAVPLFSLTIRQPQRFVATARPLLGLADDVNMAALVANELDRLSGIYAELGELSLGFDDESEEVVLQSARPFVVLRPASGNKAIDLIGVWQPRMAAVGALAGLSGLSCHETAGLVACGPGDGPPEPALFERARLALDGSGALVLARLDVAGVVGVLERLLTVPVLWGALPEIVQTVKEIRLQWSETPDRLALELVALDSGLTEAFVRLWEPIERPIDLPASAPLVAYLSVTDLRTRLDNLQDFWDNKVPIPKKRRISALINDSWQSQMLELANGVVGVVLVGDVPMDKLDPADPLDTPGLVYIMQVTDQEAVEARLKHVFNTKYFELKDEAQPANWTLTTAFWKKGRKKKKPRERLAWFFEAESLTYVFGPSALVKAFVEQRTAARESGTSRSTTLDAGKAAQVRFALGPFVNRITATSKGGIGAAMALGMVKNSLGTVEQVMDVGVRHGADTEGQFVASLEILGVLETIDESVRKADSLLQMLPKAQ